MFPNRGAAFWTAVKLQAPIWVKLDLNHCIKKSNRTEELLDEWSGIMTSTEADWCSSWCWSEHVGLQILQCEQTLWMNWSDTLTPNLWRQDTNNTPPVFVALWKRVFISLPSCLCAIKRRGRLWNHDADEKFSLEVLHLCDQTVSKSPETQFHLAVVLCFFFWFIF